MLSVFYFVGSAGCWFYYFLYARLTGSVELVAGQWGLQLVIKVCFLTSSIFVSGQDEAHQGKI